MKQISDLTVAATILVGTAIAPLASLAGTLTVANTAEKTVTCTARGNYQQQPIFISKNIEPQQSITWDAQKIDTINSLNCSGLEINNISITKTSPDKQLIYNGQAQRVLNVLLYSYLPTNPANNFSPMTGRIVQEFQRQNPEILLNPTLSSDEDLDIYTDRNLMRIFSPGGFQVVEIDALILGNLVNQGYITPIKYQTSDFVPAANDAVTYKQQLYAIPTWLCLDFIFSRQQQVLQINSAESFAKFINNSQASQPLVASFNGSWRVPSIYIKSYIDSYGYSNLPEAAKMPPDNYAISQLSQAVKACEVNTSVASNPCADKTYKNTDTYQLAQIFATGQTNAFVGFAESSFYLGLQGISLDNLYAQAMPLGSGSKPILFVDALTVNKNNCSQATCQADALKFADYLNSVKTRLWITFSEDLGASAPPRHLLPATLAFYQSDRVKNDKLYNMFAAAIGGAQAFPNYISPAMKQSIYDQVCPAIQKSVPQMKC